MYRVVDGIQYQKTVYYTDDYRYCKGNVSVVW